MQQLKLLRVIPASVVCLSVGRCGTRNELFHVRNGETVCPADGTGSVIHAATV